MILAIFGENWHQVQSLEQLNEELLMPWYIEVPPKYDRTVMALQNLREVDHELI
jgi:hypothetical protein